MADNGILNFLNSPAGQGILSGIATTLAGGGRTAAGNVGRGVLGALGGYSNAQDNILQRQQAEQRTKLFDAQMQGYQAEADARKAATERQQAQQNYLGSIGQVTSPRLDAQPNQLDPFKAVSLGIPVDTIKTLANAKNLGKSAIKDYKEVRMPDGSVQIVGFDEFGNQQNTGAAPYKAPEIRDFGGYVGGIDPISGQVSRYGNKSVSPDAAASNAVAWANVRNAQDRLAFDKEKDNQSVTYQQDSQGNLIALPTKIRAGGGQVAPVPVMAGGAQVQGKGGAKAAFGQQYEQLNSVLGEIRSLIPQATASGAGKQADAAANYFGFSTPGADAAAKLDTYGGWLTSTVPRFEGPQSDKDTMQYRVMAGDVANRSLPASQRLKSLEALVNFMDNKAKGYGIAAPERGTSQSGAPGGLPSQEAIAAELAKRRGGQ